MCTAVMLYLLHEILNGLAIVSLCNGAVQCVVQPVCCLQERP